MGHTKLAISVPDEVFQELVTRARSEGVARSAVVARALREYFDGRAIADFIKRTDEVWDSLNPDELEEIRDLSRLASRDLPDMVPGSEPELWTN